MEVEATHALWSWVNLPERGACAGPQTPQEGTGDRVDIFQQTANLDGQGGVWNRRCC
jgi:hypothetical protein